jgi:glycosyltransferase involved in cell wall biosynthesis
MATVSPQSSPVVAHFTTGLTPAAGGPYVSVAGLVRALGEDGRYAPIVAGPVDVRPPDRVCPEHWGRWPIVVGALAGNPFDSSIRDTFTQKLLATKPVVAHVHGLWDAGTYAAMRLLRCREIPLVYTPRGMLEPWALRQRWLKKKAFLFAYLKPILSRADLLHATSVEEGDAFRTLGLRQPIAVIPNGIDIPVDYVSANGGSRHASARRLLYLGRLHPKKGLENLLRAWARIERRGWQLSIAGIDEGGYAKRLVALANDLGLSDTVDFPGPQIGDDKWRFLATGAAFVHPSFSENFGIAVAEAMAAELPVVATVGTPWRCLADNRLGWWVEPTPEALAQTLTEVMQTDPAVLADMGRRSRDYVARTFAWPTIGTQMAACYDWLLGRSPAPACIRF